MLFTQDLNLLFLNCLNPHPTRPPHNLIVQQLKQEVHWFPTRRGPHGLGKLQN
jgi:hypothetical protein